MSTLNEECQTGESPCYCPICTRLQERAMLQYEAQEVLRMAREGEITGPEARNYFIGKGITTWLQPDKGSGSEVELQYPWETNPGKAAVLVTNQPESEKSEAEKRWAAIADEMNK